MFKPKFTRSFWFVCACLCSLLLNCSTFNFDKAQNGQIRRHCVVKCFHSGVETFGRALIDEKMSTRQSCFEDCMKKFDLFFAQGNRSSSGNNDTTHPFPRFKRGSEIKKDNTTGSEIKKDNTTDWRSTHECRINPRGWYMAINKTYIDVTFSNKTGNLSADISWSRAPELANVKGYKLVYAYHSPPKFRCQDLNKTNTSAKVDLSSLGLKKDEAFHIKVITLPLTNTTVELRFKNYLIDLQNKRTVSQKTTSPTAVSQKATSPAEDRPDKISLSTFVIIPVCVALISAIALALACCYLRYLRLSRSRKQDLGFEFDAFIIYNSADEEWVNKTLRRTLEDKYGLRCCLHYRDFIPGKPFRENMADSVYKSKKTIAVVSHNFFRSKYCSHEMDMALGCSLQRGDNSVIVIKLDDVDKNKLPKALKDRSFIDYGKLIERETWEKKLIDSMRPPSKQKTGLKLVLCNHDQTSMV